jgi:uncharacterized small protein (DUF1192 family)
VVTPSEAYGSPATGYAGSSGFYYPGNGYYSGEPYSSYAVQVRTDCWLFRLVPRLTIAFVCLSLFSFSLLLLPPFFVLQQTIWRIRQRIDILRAEHARLEACLRPGLFSFRRLRQIEKIQAEIARLEAELIMIQRRRRATVAVG